MKVAKKVLQDLTWMGDTDEWKVVHEEPMWTSRWHTNHTHILQHIPTGKFFETSFRQGATEQQDEQPYEYENDEIELVELVPVEVTVTKYVPKHTLKGD